MRINLQSQIVCIIVGVGLLVVAAVTTTNSWIAIRQVRRDTENELRSISETFKQSNFPVTDATLQQVKGLSGYEFILAQSGSNDKMVVVATTFAQPFLENGTTLSLNKLPQARDSFSFHEIELSDTRFLISEVAKIETFGSDNRQLYVLTEKSAYQSRIRSAYLPLIWIGLLACGLLTVVGVFAARRLVYRLMLLRDHVDRVAGGHFSQLATSTVNDEVKDLTDSINQMSQKLESYESQVRSAERQKTFEQIGRAIAHEMRNAVTGGKLALDLHLRQYGAQMDMPHVNVARQQMLIMEKSIARFLRADTQRNDQSSVFLANECIDEVLVLVSSMALHLGVQIESELTDPDVKLNGNRSDFEQALLNLLMNAIQAAAAIHPAATNQPSQSDFEFDANTTTSLLPHGSPGQVLIQSSIESPAKADAAKDEASGEHTFLIISVTDSGIGPSADIADSIFDSFITNKPDGLGLGLTMTKKIVDSFRGTIEWKRIDDSTKFTVTIPIEC